MGNLIFPIKIDELLKEIQDDPVSAAPATTRAIIRMATALDDISKSKTWAEDQTIVSIILESYR